MYDLALKHKLVVRFLLVGESLLNNQLGFLGSELSQKTITHPQWSLLKQLPHQLHTLTFNIHFSSSPIQLDSV